MSNAIANAVSNAVEKRVVGVVGRLPFSPFDYCLLAAGTAIAWAYCIELTLVIFYTFRRRTGLYFWSLLISSWGCSFHALGFILKFVTIAPPGSFLPFIEIGWVAMVTGQSFVLYSRLHLVVRKRLVLKLVLAMIIWNAITLHTPTIVLTIGSNSADGERWAPIFNIMERIQLALFCIQEFIISTIYIYHTVKLLGSIYHSQTRTVMFQLIIINSICLGMDVILIGLEYSNKYVGEVSIKPMLYAIKLKLEFAVLNQLVGLTQRGLTEGGMHRQNNFNPDHEFHNGVPPHSSNDNIVVPSRTTRIFRGSVSKSVSGPKKRDEIVQTQQVEVISEPKSNYQIRSSSLREPSADGGRRDQARSPFDIDSPVPLLPRSHRGSQSDMKSTPLIVETVEQKSSSPSLSSDEAV